MDGGDWASVVAAVFAALAAIAVQRSSSKANVQTKQLESESAKENTRAEAEKDAYERARTMDVATINRLSEEITQVREQYDEVREQNEHLNNDVKRLDADNRSLHDQNRLVLEDNARLRAEVRALRIRQVRLERGIHPTNETPVQERREDLPPWSEAVTDPFGTATDTEPYPEVRGDERG